MAERSCSWGLLSWERRQDDAAPQETTTDIIGDIMKRNTRVVLTTLILGTAVGPLAFGVQAQRNRGMARPDPGAQAALFEALAGPEGEYAARAEYAAIIEKFGAKQPYTAILQAEERHIAALARLLERRGLPVPADPYVGKVQAPDTLLEAAQEGVRAEELNVAMYDRLLAASKEEADLQTVFGRLQSASRERHLSAFKAAVENQGVLADRVPCGQANGQRRGGPPPWAGARGPRGQGGCGGCGGCGLGLGSQVPDHAAPGVGRRWHQPRRAGGPPSGH